MSTAITLRRSFDRYPMIMFYAQSRKKQCSEATNHQCVERLNTIFDELIDNYGVILHERWVEKLTGHVLQSWFNDFVDTRKPSTINNYLSFLNPFPRWAFKIGYMPDDLAGLLRTLRIPSVDKVPEWERPQEKYLTHAQVVQLLENMDIGTYAKRNRAIAALFLFSGIRVSELCSLTIGSVFGRPRGTLYCKRKGGAWCDVEISMDVYPYLDDYLETRKDRDNLSAPLFLSARGNPMDRFSVYAAIRPVQEKLGVATGPHALRHTYISEVEKLSSPSVARDLANHKSIRITNRYDHSSPEQRRDAVDKLHWGNVPKLG